MDLILNRLEFRSDGIFSQLSDAENFFACHTLEHSYRDSEGYFPKIPTGTFLCQRGKHELHGMTEPFETFEITGVPGHSNLLFHWGNFQKDSEGCVLVGALLTNMSGIQMITNSRQAFARFMKMQEGCDSFNLTVVI